MRPNIECSRKAGGKTNRGILIDTEGKTSIADVYAAGDCVVSHDISNGQDRILAILPNAYMQGYTAGINMAGGTSTFEQAIPLNAMASKDCTSSRQAVTT
jgi:NADPH-dependent 2,4-dienoyl-CoA reductase/sulfur reductase-like enzyme